MGMAGMLQESNDYYDTLINAYVPEVELSHLPKSQLYLLATERDKLAAVNLQEDYCESTYQD